MAIIGRYIKGKSAALVGEPFITDSSGKPDQSSNRVELRKVQRNDIACPRPFHPLPVSFPVSFCFPEQQFLIKR